MKRTVRLVVSLGLSVAFLWLAFRDVDLDAVGSHWPNIDARYVALYVAALVVTQLCRIFRWDVLIRPFARITLAQLFRVSNLGLMLILVLPLRLGELARPYLLKQECGASMSAGLGAVAVERVIDGLLVTGLFFLTTLWLDAPYQVPVGLQAIAYVTLAVFGGGLAFIVGALVAGQGAVEVVRRVGQPLAPKLTAQVTRMLGSFVSGLKALPDARAVGVFVAWTVVYWTVNALGLYWAMKAFGWELPPLAGFVLVGVLVLGIMIPAGPGHLGTYQAALMAGLAVFGVDSTDAAAYGLLVYPLNVLVIVGAGVPYMFGRAGQVRSILEASDTA